MPKIFAQGSDAESTKWLMKILSNCNVVEDAKEEFVRKIPITLTKNQCLYSASHNNMLELLENYDVTVLPDWVKDLRYPEATKMICESNVVCLAMRGGNDLDHDRIVSQMADLITKTAYINYVANGTPIIIFYFGKYNSGLSNIHSNIFTNNFGDTVTVDIKKAQTNLPTIRAVNDFYNYCPAMSDFILVENMKQLHSHAYIHYWNIIGKYLFISFGYLRKISCNHNIREYGENPVNK